MGIFNNADKQTAKQSGATIIASGTTIIGGINTPGSVHIDGKFEGVILDADMISIGTTGELIGDVKTNSITINGLFDGKIDCSTIHILSKGRVIGDILYSELIIDEKGMFEGKGVRKGSELTSRYGEIEKKINNIVGNQFQLEHEEEQKNK
ncbi:MAG: polymer-forming cytoskeletal protein [Campylobacterales bacterium]|nr:polymer-forming cytoskeletal protein [Campylobacterales bacterium]NQY52494.1 polymer-forming cytoskeletal protein [Campylobacteraceae bacterium]